MKADQTPLTKLAVLIPLMILHCERGVSADELANTDANIVTAVDISLSIDAADAKIEIEGLADAICAPEVMRAIKTAHYGRIGFAVIAWHSDVYPVLVPWTVVGSEEEARAVSDRLRARLPFVIETISGTLGSTDISGAIKRAALLLKNAPYSADRLIANIVGNGEDNVREGPDRARDILIVSGGTINGVVLGGDLAVAEYYRRHVIGGPGAFLMSADDADTITQVLVRKLLRDIATNGSPDD